MTLLLGILWVSFGVAMVVSWRLWRSLRTYRIKKYYTAALDAPSVSVCIPARNEVHAMSLCLENVLMSDYPKLEVIVYDDSSADETSLVVRSFAHAGVRFVPGSPLPEGWLGKNHALDVLAREASGTYVLFMDVDTRVEPTTISQLVGYLMTEEASMVSVVPRRNDTWRSSVLFGTLRYFWPLILAGGGNPASAGTFWLANRRMLLEQFDGLRTLKARALPEAHFATTLGSAYRFLLPDNSLGVSFEKKWSSQIETSRRLLYATFGGAWWSYGAGVLLLALLVMPVILLPVLLIQGDGAMATLAASVVLAYGLLYTIYLRSVWRRGAFLGVVVWPIVIVQELILLILSGIGYATGTVTWKGRSVQMSPANRQPED